MSFYYGNLKSLVKYCAFNLWGLSYFWVVSEFNWTVRYPFDIRELVLEYSIKGDNLKFSFSNSFEVKKNTINNIVPQDFLSAEV